MKIKIMSKRAIEKYAETPMTEKVAVISITDARGDFAILTNQPEYIFKVAFDDVDNDVIIDEVGQNASEEERKQVEKKYKMFSDEQAEDMATFYFSICENVECIICQCEHGQSRSAAVAAAIMEFRNRRGIKVFADDRYYPNKVVFRKLLAELKNRG